MPITVIVQARMTSKRLPGKVLRMVRGKPMMGYLLERLRGSKKIAKIIVATSTNKSDQAIFDYCQETKTECFRGDLDNVAKRFKEVIERYRLDSFIRICGDSPLIDAAVVDSGIEIFEQGKYEIVTNVFKYTFPHGQNFEILRSDAFLKGYKVMKDPEDLEHVTRYFYRNADQFKIYNMVTGGDYSQVNLCVDTEKDFEMFENILKNMDRPFLDYRWPEIVAIYKTLKKG